MRISSPRTLKGFVADLIATGPFLISADVLAVIVLRRCRVQWMEPSPYHAVVAFRFNWNFFQFSGLMRRLLGGLVFLTA